MENDKIVKIKYENEKYYFNFANYCFLIHDNFIDKRFKKKIVCKYPLCNCDFIFKENNIIFIDYNQKYENKICFLNISLNRNLRYIHECNCFIRFQEKYKNNGYINTVIMVVYKDDYDLKNLMNYYKCDAILNII